MIIRKIKPDELRRTYELFSLSFHQSYDNMKSPQQIYEDTSTAPQSREDRYCLERWAAFEDDDQTMLSFFIAQPFMVRFDGHFCSMRGIGGVATLPQYRRRGGIRACFSHALPDMYQNKVHFSFLYPFSNAYYRQFGYEICCERLKYMLPLTAIPPYSLEGSYLLSEGSANHLAEIKEIYEVWMYTYNLMVKNEAFEYGWLNAPNPAKDQDFTYTYKAKNGRPKSFLRGKMEISADHQRILKCQKFIFTDREGFQALMMLAKNFCDLDAIQFELPASLNITPLLPEWCNNGGRCEKNLSGMARAVHVPEILKLAKYKGSGALNIQLSDPMIAENNGCFSVKFAADQAVSVEKTTMPPHISMSIHDFSCLIIGSRSCDDLKYMESVQVYADLDSIAKVFYQKPNYITEPF